MTTVTDDELARHLLYLEQQLRPQTVRADDYFEHGINSTLWRNAAVTDTLANEQFSKRRISRFVLTRLAADTALMTCAAERQATVHRSGARSLRSSAWQWRGARGQMVFHQGTPLAAP